MTISKIRQIESANFKKTDKIISQVLDDRHLRQETPVRYHNTIVEFLRNKKSPGPLLTPEKSVRPSYFLLKKSVAPLFWYVKELLDPSFLEIKSSLPFFAKKLGTPILPLKNVATPFFPLKKCRRPLF